MKLKRVLISLVTIVIFVITFSMQYVVNAATAQNPIYLGITEIMTEDTPNMGYAIGDPNTNGTTGMAAKIWNIVKYTSATSTDPTEINAFCVKAGVGFSDTKKRATYDVFYDMKTERESIKAQNDVLRSIVEGTVPYGEETVSKYDALLAAIDMLYLPGDSSEANKTELLESIIDYAKLPTSGYTSYVGLMQQYPLTNDDITAVEQAALWYFTNYGEESGKYDKTSNTGWLNYTLDGSTYDALSNYTPNGLQPQYDAGQARSYQAEILYNYIINQAKANASKYSSSSSSTAAPAKVNTTKLNYEESGDNYIIGPIKITETTGNTIPYTIDFTVKNENTQISNYTLLDNNKTEVTDGTTVKDLVGENFYLSLPKTSVTNLSVKIDIKYKSTTMTLWASSTNNQEQPILIPSKEDKSVPLTLTFSPESPKVFDLALRKYITKINNVELTGTNSRVPSIDESTLQSGTTATYKHRKDAVTVATGDKVIYKLTIYNEGEKAGRATKIVDQLPTGLKFNRIVSGNFELDSYNETTNNTLSLKRVANNTTNLPAYSDGNLTSGTGTETIEIECTVTATPDTENSKVLTNVAWISEEIDEDGTVITNQSGVDRDSEPATTPSVNKDNMSNYTGNSSNKNNLADSTYYYKGQQDDDDFEKLVLLPKSFDLALRKYITKINDVELTETNSRVPVIDESTISSETTTATYKHKKDPVTIETGDKVTYKLTIYNEGEKAGRATKIVDQLPTGLKFNEVKSGNFELDSYSESTNNTLVLKRVESNTTNLPAYTKGYLTSGKGTETIEIECIVIAKPDTENSKVLTNVAWISEEIDEDGTVITNQSGADRDSEPATTPSVNKDNMSNYVGNSSNKDNLADSTYYYKGQQDDDDFEKLVLLPETFDLKLIKSIYEVNGKAVTERLKSIDVSKLNVATNAKTTASYKMDKNPVSVAKGDIVTYRLRVYNEGTIDGYAKEISENIPEGLEFIWSEKEGEELEADTTLSDAEKEAVEFNQRYLWGNFKYDDSREKIVQISSDYLSKEQETTVGGNLIEAFGRNDGTKTASDLSYKEIFVKMKVVSDNITGVTIRNEAAVTDDSDEDGNDIEDRDSSPEDWNKEDSDEYYDDEEKWPVYEEDDEDYDNIILRPFDLALRKFIIAVSDDEEIDNDEYLKDENGQYTRAPQVDTSKLNTSDENGKLITTATYNHTKEPVKVKKNDIVVYMLRVYNEGEVDGYAAEIKDHLPSYLEFVDGEFNEQYGWTISEDGRTATTTYLADQKIKAAEMTPLMLGALGQTIGGEYVLTYKEVPIMCKVKDNAKVNEKITNIADITKYLDDNKEPVNDRDSSENNVELPRDEDLPKYKDDETGDYIPGQEDDDDFEKVIIPKFDLALRKQIVSIHNAFKNQDTAYNNRYAKLDKSQNNTIYDYYDVESNIPTVVENDVVTYSIRVYNEGEVDGTATWVTDRLPSGLEYLSDNETNKKYGWKAFKLSSKDAQNAVKIGEKYYEEVSFDSKEIYMYATEYLKDSTIKAYTGTGEASYLEVFMATRVKAKSEVAEGTEYKLRNIAEIGEDNGDDYDSTPGDESDWKDQDDLDIEDLKLVEFDLALRKWVTEAIVIENGQTTVTPTGHKPYDDPEQVVKVELHRKKLSQVVVKFRYSIRVINEGEIAGYAKEVTDYVPQGLKFLAEDNQGWTDEGNNVISTRLLENTLLQPGEYADVEVVLTWQNSENNMGVMTNIAEISEDENEYGVPDIDSTPDNQKWGEDDIDDAPVMLSITTGQVRIYFILGFAVLATVAGGVVLIKKFVL